MNKIEKKSEPPRVEFELQVGIRVLRIIQRITSGFARKGEGSSVLVDERVHETLFTYILHT
jgi:hypothetical protein